MQTSLRLSEWSLEPQARPAFDNSNNENYFRSCSFVTLTCFYVALSCTGCSLAISQSLSNYACKLYVSIIKDLLLHGNG
jgi:hypothetical protein